MYAVACHPLNRNSLEAWRRVRHVSGTRDVFDAYRIERERAEAGTETRDKFTYFSRPQTKVGEVRRKRSLSHTLLALSLPSLNACENEFSLCRIVAGLLRVQLADNAASTAVKFHVRAVSPQVTYLNIGISSGRIFISSDVCTTSFSNGRLFLFSDVILHATEILNHNCENKRGNQKAAKCHDNKFNPSCTDIDFPDLYKGKHHVVFSENRF